MKKCPKCGFVANTVPNIEIVFGFRKVNGKQIPQSYCRECRGGKPAAVKEVNPIPYIAIDNPIPISKGVSPKAVLKDAKTWDLRAVLASGIHRIEVELVKCYGEDLKVPEDSPLETERQAAENLFQLLCQKNFVALGPESLTDVHELTESWTLCDDCHRVFVKDPKAAGWKRNDFRDGWKCKKCQYDDLEYPWFAHKKDKCTLSLGLGKKLERSFTRLQVKARVKALEKGSLEREFWNQGTPKSWLNGRDSLGGGSSVIGKFIPFFKELLNYKEPPPLPETLKL